MAKSELMQLLEQLPSEQQQRMAVYAKSLGIREGDVVFPLLVILESYSHSLSTLSEQVDRNSQSLIDSITAKAQEMAAQAAAEEATKAKESIARSEVQATEQLRITIHNLVEKAVTDTAKQTKKQLKALRDAKAQTGALISLSLFALGVGCVSAVSAAFGTWLYLGGNQPQAELGRRIVTWSLDEIVECLDVGKSRCEVWVTKPPESDK
ncbi:MAG: hypothetical protein F6J89_08300 [Symploca sp. SIO1C4]|uniref:Uncharacterized protein n=1 Tax=Symploca sp. SIO1C4 TaxID=2607765 RepID=A0A6B3NAK7_9CYAN|nr:hypothetical protein [Symploca sp. SIO1C4]